MESNDEQRAKVRRVRRWIVLAMVVGIGGIFAWSALFNPAAKADASDAFYACVDRISRDVLVRIDFPGPGDATYEGTEGAWTIAATFTSGADEVPWTCHALRVSEGLYRVSWE